MTRRPRRSTLFPYTTLFRSGRTGLVSDAAVIGLIGDLGQVQIEGRERHLVRRVLVQLAAMIRAHGEWAGGHEGHPLDRKSTRLNSSHLGISYAVFCLKKKKT